MVQWIRIHLPVQGLRVQSLVQEDPTCLEVGKPMCRYYEKSHTLEPKSRTTEPECYGYGSPST